MALIMGILERCYRSYCTQAERSATDQIMTVSDRSPLRTNLQRPNFNQSKSPITSTHKATFNKRIQSFLSECSWLECLLRRRAVPQVTRQNLGT